MMREGMDTDAFVVETAQTTERRAVEPAVQLFQSALIERRNRKLLFDSFQVFKLLLAEPVSTKYRGKTAIVVGIKEERVTRDEAHSDAYVNSVNGLRVTIISYQKASGEYLVEAPNGATAFTRAKYLKVDDPSVVL